MRSRVRAGLSFANVTALIALVLAMGAGASALTAPSVPKTLHGCVGRRTGALRIVAAGASCHRLRRRAGRVIDRGEYAIAFNAQGPAGPAGMPGAAGAPGTAGTPGTPGAPGVVDTSQFFTKTQADARYLGIGAVTYGQGATNANGNVVASWPQLGFQIVTVGPTVSGTIALGVIDSGTQNINGAAMVSSGPSGATISTTQFGLDPTVNPVSGAFTTDGPFIDFAIVASGSTRRSPPTCGA